VNRLGAILIPMLAGFLLTVAVVSLRSGGWPWRAALESRAAAPLRVEARHPNLRIVPVHLTDAQPPTVATPARVPATAAVPTAAQPAAETEAAPEPYEPPPVPRVDPGNSPEQLEAPDRKFAHGRRDDGD
jgi:hypothetical protein